MHFTQNVNELLGEVLVEKLLNIHTENWCLSNTEDEKTLEHMVFILNEAHYSLA